MNSKLRIESLPQLSELLTDLFQQLQISGLLFAYFDLLQPGSDESVLSQLSTRRDILYKIATMLESYMPGALVVSGTPAIANAVQWNNKNDIGGYAGADLTVSLSDLLASYRGCWRHAVMYPPFTFTRFARLGFWYWRKKNDPFSALGLLLDMYKTGFFLRMKDFGSAIMPICYTFTAGLDLKKLWKLDFASQSAEADAIILQATAKSMERPLLNDRVQLLNDWISDRAIEDVDAARKASSLDQWLIVRAWLYFMADALPSFEKIYKGRLNSTQRMIASQFEEIRADLGGLAVSDRTRGKDGSPFLFHLSSIYGVAFEYQRINGSTWLDKMIEERVPIPDALCEAVRVAYVGADLPAVRKIEIPPAWKMPSELMGGSLCAIFNRNPLNECSFEFEDGAIVARCKSLGHSPRHGEKGDKPEHFSPEAQREAREELAAARFQKVLRGKNPFWETPTKAIKRFEEVSRLYPWNSLVRRELGSRYDLAGDTPTAFREMRAAVLLDPGDADSWHSLSIVLGRMNSPKDAAVAEGISKTFEAMQ